MEGADAMSAPKVKVDDGCCSSSNGRCEIDGAECRTNASNNPEANEVIEDESDRSALRKGFLEHGCKHYRRRCQIRAPCCGEFFPCRHCHNEKWSEDPDAKRYHTLPREEVELVLCSLCGEEQPVQQVCRKCGVCMGEYFCGICKFYDDSVEKEQFHCESCGICRVGGRDKFFHCKKCGCCYALALESSHTCVEKSMHNNCPICFEYLFDSIRNVQVLPCGHTIHVDCYRDMCSHSQFTCPLCSRSLLDLSQIWEAMDVEVAETPMPEPYREKKVDILCNDCQQSCEVNFHIVGLKCAGCGSYNTRRK